jgi:hypothetical protein
VDSTVRFPGLEEVRSDLIFTGHTTGRWDAPEVQMQVDRSKGRRWPVLVSLLLNQHGEMGDLIVLTPNRSVAKWAPGACDWVGPLGTVLRLIPIVLHVGKDQVAALLDESHPKLAFFAAWAMHKRYGPAARRVVEKALEITSKLPKRLQEAQIRAILDVTHERLYWKLKERMMDNGQFFDPPWQSPPWVLQHVAELEARGEARGKATAKREALLAVMHARGLQSSAGQQKQIAACSDLDQLDQWITRAVTATTLDAILPPLPRYTAHGKHALSPGNTNGASKRRSAKAS